MVIQLKKNQGTLYAQVEYGCKRFNPLDYQEDPLTKSHGRLEQRKYEVFDTVEMLRKWPEWKHVKRIIRVTRIREVLKPNGVVESEISYYGSNRRFSVQEFSRLIREHWWCENKNHYVKDTAFREDGTVKKVGAFLYSVLISSAFNIMRINKSKNIRGDLYTNAMDFNKMINMINHL